MRTTEQSTVKPRSRIAISVIDPAERQRRLSKVYGILLQLAVQEEIAPIVGFESIRPNPFRTETTIVFSLEDADHVEVTIYDVAGRPTRTLVSRSFPAGRHSVQWDGRDKIGHRVESGVYFLKVRDRSRTMTRKLVMFE